MPPVRFALRYTVNGVTFTDTNLVRGYVRTFPSIIP